MTDEKKIFLVNNKIQRLQSSLTIMEQLGDEDGYDDIDAQLTAAINKLERLQNKDNGKGK